MESTCPALSTKLVQSSEGDLKDEGEVKGREKEGMGADMLCNLRASYKTTVSIDFLVRIE